MDIMTIQRRLAGLAGRGSYGLSAPAGIGGTAGTEDRIKDLVKRVNARKSFKNRWGGQDYPVDVADYGQFLSTLQTLGWVLNDLGYEVHYMTRQGLSYSNNQFYNQATLFDRTKSQVVALVAIGKQGKHYRFTRDGKTMRVRQFSEVASALAPTRDGDTAGTKPMNASLAKELVRFMARQSTLDPSKDDAIRKWARVTSGMRPVTGGLIKKQLDLEFKKYPRS